MVDMVNLTPHFALHGKYVGPGHTGGPKLGTVDFRTEPTDALDAAARVHDYQYVQQPRNRGAADAMLSTNAWRVAMDSSQPISVRAKSLLVAGAMHAMSKMGSRNGESLPMPQSARNHRAFHVPTAQATAIRSMGAHGEITGTDDLSRRQPAFRNGQRTQPPRAAKAPRPSANNADIKALIQAVKAAGGSISAKKTPTQTKQASAGTTYATGVPLVSQRGGTIESIKIRNFKVKLQDVVTPATVASGTALLVLPVDRNLFGRTALKPIFQLFNRWSDKSTRLTVIPALATNTAGNVQTVVDTDPTDVPIIGNNLDEAYFSGHGRKMLEHSAFGAPWGVTLPGSRNLLYTDTPRITNAPSGSSDPRLSSAGLFVVAAATGFTLTSTNIGSLWATVNADFSVSDYSEDDGVIACIKAVSLTGSTLTGAAMVFDIAQLLALVQNNSSNVYAEYSIQANCFDGALFKLSKGLYYVKALIGLSGAPGATNVNLNTSGVFSSDMFSNALASNTLFPEFSVANLSTFVPQVSSSASAGILRVTGTGSSRPGFFSFDPVFNTTNAVKVTTMEFVILRCPSVLTEAYTQPFPFGNDSFNIELSAAETPSGKKITPPPAPMKPIVMTHRDYDDWKEYLATRDVAMRVDFEEKTPVMVEKSAIEGPPKIIAPSTSTLGLWRR